MTAEEMLDVIYGLDPEGGPDGGERHVSCTMWNHYFTTTYAALDLKLMSTRSSESKSRYELIPASLDRGSR